MEPLRYLLLTSLYALALWGIYATTLRNRPQHRQSRIYLLLSMVLPAILPLLRLPAAFAQSRMALSVHLPEVFLNAVSGPPPASLQQLVPAVYLCGCALIAVAHLVSFFRLRAFLRARPALQHQGYTFVPGTGIGPGSFGRMVFIPGEAAEPAILRHELAHIQAGHRFDLLLLFVTRTLFWISPAHWLLGRELRAVHEFEADRIASRGTDTSAYTALLLRAQFGIYRPSLFSHSFFHHPLKRRIMMLRKTNALNAGKLLAAAVLLTVGFTGSVVYAQTKGAGKNVAATALLAPDVLERNYSGPQPGTLAGMTGGQMVFTKVDQMPRFNGELMKWLVANVRSPEKDISGRCIVAFTIDPAGNVTAPFLKTSSGNERLDAEAMRVVRSMPKWKPGVHSGSPVAVQYDLPFNFGRIGDGC